MNTKTLQYIPLAINLILLFGCVENYPVQGENENNSPNTTLANIPVPYDTLFALTTLTWDGGDDDGFVVAYEYRYTTYPLGDSQGDSIVHDWVWTEESSLEISFTSPDTLNLQHFEIRAIDNSDNIDPTPAVKEFYTTQTRTPETFIIEPLKNSEFFILEEGNAWIPGVTLKFSGSDRDGRILEYGWSVDGSEFQWVDAADTVVVVKPSEFAQPLSDWHTFKVIAKDDTHLLDPVGAEVRFRLVVPTFEKDIFILDDTREAGDLGIRDVADSTVDNFYRDIFASDTTLVIKERNLATSGMPDLDRLGSYKLVIYHADDTKGDIETFYMVNGGALATFASYLQVGGKMIIIGDIIAYHSQFLPPIPAQSPYPHPTPVVDDSFIFTYLNIQSVEMSPLSPGTFEGATGVNGFPDVEIDASKINPDFPHFGRNIQVAGIVKTGGFTKAISLFAGPDPFAAGLPVAVRYYGDVFDITFVGFPMWTLKFEDAKEYAAAILRDMGY